MDDNDTLALYHFDQITGSKLNDFSGNSHHGNVLGSTHSLSQQPPQLLSEMLDRIFLRKAKAIILHEGKRVTIENAEQIPQGPFELRGINQHYTAETIPNSLNDDDCELIAKFSSIDELHLSGTGITSQGIQKLASLQNLRHLSVPRYMDDPTTVATLFPNLRAISAPYQRTDEFLESLEGHSSIQSVSLFRTKYTLKGLASLKKVPNLKMLICHGKRLDKPTLEAISQLTHLEYLALNFEEEDPLTLLDPLAKLASIKSIHVAVRSQSLSDQCADYLKKLHPSVEVT